MTIIAGKYIQDLKKIRRERPEPGPERDEELADIIQHYCERAVRLGNTPRITIQWYPDGSATATGEGPGGPGVWTTDTQ